MLRTLSVFCATFIVGLALIGDAQSTGVALLGITTIRGAAFLIRKITWSLSKDMADLIDFAAWCLCAISFVNIIRSAQIGLDPITSFFASISNLFSSAKLGINEIAEIIDKITFWN